MNLSEDLKNVLDVTAKILIRCFFMNFALILFWWCFFLIGRGYGFRALIYNITPHEFALFTYYGIAFVKLCNIMFFLLPYIAIRWMLKVEKS